MTVVDPRTEYDDILEYEVDQSFDASTFEEMRGNEAFSMGWVAIGVVIDPRDRILLAYRTDTDAWAAPGGTRQTGEALTETLQREVREETGIVAEPIRPHAIVDVVGTHEDTAETLSFSVVHYHAAAPETEPGTDLGEDDEAIERAAWFDELPEHVYERNLTADVLDRVR